jgi:phage recombination protein Bet
MLETLKATAFKGNVSNEQMMALLIVADQYGLNPWTKEVYAFPDKNNGIVPVVGVDGWARIINSHPEFDGMEFCQADAEAGCVPDWIECVVHRKDRAHPIRVREHYTECKRSTAPWQSHPRRMLRHKAMIQCARLAFGFVGIYDEDEAARIVDVTPLAPEHVATPSPAAIAAKSAAAKAAEKSRGKKPVTIEAEAAPAPEQAPETAEEVARDQAEGHDAWLADAGLVEQ